MAFIQVTIENQEGYLNTDKIMYVKANRNHTTAVYLIDGSKVTVNLGFDELRGLIQTTG